jgi:hypothetical protein
MLCNAICSFIVDPALPLTARTTLLYVRQLSHLLLITVFDCLGSIVGKALQQRVEFYIT